MTVDSIHVETGLEKEEINQSKLIKDVPFIFIFVQILTAFLHELRVSHCIVKNSLTVLVCLLFALAGSKIGKDKERRHHLGLFKRVEVIDFMDPSLE